jgi:hypothetical protein
MSSRRKQTRVAGWGEGYMRVAELRGGLPTGETYEGREVIQDAAGFEYPAPRAGEDRARSRQTAPLDRQAMFMNPLTYALALPGVQQSMSQAGGLKMSDLAKLKMTSKELRDNIALQEAVAAGTFKRLKGRGDQFIYRYMRICSLSTLH